MEGKREGRDRHGLRGAVRERLIIWLLRAVARLPLFLVHQLGACVGWLMARIPNRQRRNALINIRLCFPHLDGEQALALRRQSLIEYGKTYSEIAYLWFRPARKVLSLVREVSGDELLRRDDGRGVIVLSLHLGAWEMGGVYLPTQGPATVLYKPQPELDWLIREVRERAGAELVSADRRGIRRLAQALRRGEYVGILPDQEPRVTPGSVFAPFFGVPALTMLLVNQLARKTGARVIFAFAVRLPRAQGFHIHCLPAPAGVDSEDEITAATALNRGIENAIRVCPEQYFWAYKRFRKRPSGMPPLYRGSL